jgi:hypothetical protein
MVTFGPQPVPSSNSNQALPPLNQGVPQNQVQPAGIQETAYTPINPSSVGNAQAGLWVEKAKSALIVVVVLIIMIALGYFLAKAFI